MSYAAPAASTRPTAPTPPGSVTAAAVTTIVASSLTALLVLFLGVGYAFVGQTFIDYFNEAGSIIVWFFGIVLTSLALCAIAVWASVSLLRRRL